MDYQFTTDGCSGGLMCLLRILWRVRYWLGRVPSPVPPWETDCEAHDAVYAPGGTAADRLRADLVLAHAVSSRGYTFLARAMFIGVSLGGVPWLPLPWRWGYGWKWPTAYRNANPEVTS